MYVMLAAHARLEQYNVSRKLVKDVWSNVGPFALCALLAGDIRTVQDGGMSQEQA